jgi:hypothetical protein
MTACKGRALVDRHFEGTISPPEERTMREHLPTCEGCRAYYERWLILAKLDPEGISAETRIARGLGLGRRPLARVFPIGVATLVAAAAALVLFLRVAPDTGFTARGAAHAAPASRVFVYEVRPGAPPGLASGTVGRRDELAFAYENGAAKNRVMIFGVDEHQHVYWFYPAYKTETENPVAIPIEKDARRHELPEAVRHDLDGAHLEVRAVFLDTPMPVREMEALVREHPTGPLPIAGAVEDSASFALSP